ncbi:MAG: archaeal proteasome endopeptidase complex subunit beta [Thermoplasmatota archaeon]
MENKKGTTTVGLVCDGAVVVASERRATMGTMIAHKRAKKLYRIDDHLALTTAGLVGDAQMLARYLGVESELYKLQREADMPIKGAATLLGNILNQRKFAPFFVQLIIAGVDTNGTHVFSVDAAGGAIEDIYTSTGSGSPYVLGVLEDHYREDMNIEEGVDLAIRALTAAMKRDSASGNGIDLAVITPEGYTSYSEEDIEERAAAMEIQ